MNILRDHTFLKFIIVGIINTVVGSAIMFVLYNLTGVGYWISSAVNYTLTSVLSFFLNKHFTFGIRQRSVLMIIAFIANIAVCYLIAYGVAKPAMDYLLQNSTPKIRGNIALLTGMCLFTGLNYFGQRFIVFNVK